jgi:hypothetical protein
MSNGQHREEFCLADFAPFPDPKVCEKQPARAGLAALVASAR